MAEQLRIVFLSGLNQRFLGFDGSMFDNDRLKQKPHIVSRVATSKKIHGGHSTRASVLNSWVFLGINA